MRKQQEDEEAKLRAQLLEKQRELLLIQQKQLDLESEQARSRLEMQTKQLTENVSNFDFVILSTF